jgi:hypothetical protein
MSWNQVRSCLSTVKGLRWRFWCVIAFVRSHFSCSLTRLLLILLVLKHQLRLLLLLSSLFDATTVKAIRITSSEVLNVGLLSIGVETASTLVISLFELLINYCRVLGPAISTFIPLIGRCGCHSSRHLLLLQAVMLVSLIWVSGARSWHSLRVITFVWLEVQLLCSRINFVIYY